MKTFEYSFISKLIYRYSNIPITLLALYFFVLSLLFLPNDWRFIFLTILSIAIIVFVNKKFMYTYKYFPFKIKADNKGLICTDFYNSAMEITIPFADIDKIEGGVFEGKPTKPIYIYVGNKKIIGIMPQIKNYNGLVTIILSKINKNVYNSTLAQINELNKFLNIKKKKSKKNPSKNDGLK